MLLKHQTIAINSYISTKNPEQSTARGLLKSKRILLYHHYFFLHKVRIRTSQEIHSFREL